MTRRANQPDTMADVQLRSCIIDRPPKSFVMIAGAGSGKTTSLIKALSAIVERYGDRLKLRRQRVACITYTEIAAGEIWADVGNNPLIQVSTIHSFLWALVKPFQADIRQWVATRIEEKLKELREAACNFGPRVKERTREKNRRDQVRYEQDRQCLPVVKSFTYGTGSNYSTGMLGHDDVIKMVSQHLSERRLFRSLLAQQFPFLFVDESQDTTQQVVDALKAVNRQMPDQFCLGFFGDPMQQIYPTGVGPISAEVGWVSINKPENFRCPASVLAVANNIRRAADGLVQEQGRNVDVAGSPHPVSGAARLFVLPADNRRDDNLAAVRRWMAAHTGDSAWQAATDSSVKVLVIVHRMAAVRLGFAQLYSALNDKAPESFKTGFADASAWPLRPFVKFVLPLVDASRHGREFEAISILRNNCPSLAKESMKGKRIAQLLSGLRASTLRLVEMMSPAAAFTNRDLLLFIKDQRLLDLEPRLLAYLEDNRTATAGNPGVAEESDEDDGEDATREIAAMDAFLNCPASQLWAYSTYVNEQSPFSTQQGIKGTEFPRVLVVLDDEEATHVQFSYDKLFGIKSLSTREEENRREGKDTSIERTRRLFYVCCTRTLSDLAVVLFTRNVDQAFAKVRTANIFPSDSIHSVADLTA